MAGTRQAAAGSDETEAGRQANTALCTAAAAAEAEPLAGSRAPAALLHMPQQHCYVLATFQLRADCCARAYSMAACKLPIRPAVVTCAAKSPCTCLQIRCHCRNNASNPPGLIGELGSSSVGGPGASDAVYSELPHGAPMNGEYPVIASPADASDPELPSELIRPSCQRHTQDSRAGGNTASQHQLHLHLATTASMLVLPMPVELYQLSRPTCPTQRLLMLNCKTTKWWSTTVISKHTGTLKSIPARGAWLTSKLRLTVRAETMQDASQRAQRVVSATHCCVHSCALEARERAEHRLAHVVSTGPAYSLAGCEWNCGNRCRGKRTCASRSAACSTPQAASDRLSKRDQTHINQNPTRACVVLTGIKERRALPCRPNLVNAQFNCRGVLREKKDRACIRPIIPKVQGHGRCT